MITLLLLLLLVLLLLLLLSLLLISQIDNIIRGAFIYLNHGRWQG